MDFSLWFLGERPEEDSQRLGGGVRRLFGKGMPTLMSIVISGWIQCCGRGFGSGRIRIILPDPDRQCRFDIKSKSIRIRPIWIGIDSMQMKKLINLTFSGKVHYWKLWHICLTLMRRMKLSMLWLNVKKSFLFSIMCRAWASSSTHDGKSAWR